MTLELSENALSGLPVRIIHVAHICTSLDSIREDILQNPFYFPGSVVAGLTKPKPYTFLKANTGHPNVSPEPFSGVAINQHLPTITLLVKQTTVSCIYIYIIFYIHIRSYQYLALFPKRMEPQSKQRNCWESSSRHNMKQRFVQRLGVVVNQLWLGPNPSALWKIPAGGLISLPS